MWNRFDIHLQNEINSLCPLNVIVSPVLAVQNDPVKEAVFAIQKQQFCNDLLASLPTTDAHEVAIAPMPSDDDDDFDGRWACSN